MPRFAQKALGYLPSAASWQVMGPGLAMILSALLLMGLTWGISARFGLQDSGIRPHAVMLRPADPAAADALLQRADRLTALARAAEARALSGPADPDTLERYRKLAELYQDWARETSAQARAREATLASHDALRTLWAYGTTLDLLACSVGGLVAWGIALRAMGRLRSRGRVSKRAAKRVLTTIAVVPAAVYFGFMEVWRGFDTPAHLLARAALPEPALRTVAMDDSLHVAMALMYVAACWVAVAAPALARRQDGSDDHAGSAREIADSMRLVRYTLYMGAAMLVVYVATVSSFFHWVSAFVDPADEAVASGVDALARSAVTARSFIATGLVAMVYLPSAMCLKLMAVNLAERALPEGSVPQREEWMKTHGILVAGTVDHLKPVAAILAPLLAGPVAEVLQHAIA
ncbi:MAG TPA: hypothetical protein VEQ60_28850 [Longimicrobium sp.]|nr:hypothetical protein [Longimicrobium sp.]